MLDTGGGKGGNYFTDRFTAGELSLVLADRTVDYADYESAQEHAARHGR